MPKLARIPDETSEQVYNTLTEFGSVRKKALVKYTERAILDSEYLTDEDKTEYKRLAEKLLQELTREKRIATVKYAQESVVLPFRETEIRFETMNAFEAYVAIIEEMAAKGIKSRFCHAGRSDYPFDFAFAAANEAFYRVIVFNDEAIAKLNFMNATNVKERDKHYTSLLVVPDTYPLDSFASVSLKGKSRLALLSKEGKAYSCMISEVMEG